MIYALEYSLSTPRITAWSMSWTTDWSTPSLRAYVLQYESRRSSMDTVAYAQDPTFRRLCPSFRPGPLDTEYTPRTPSLRPGHSVCAQERDYAQEPSPRILRARRETDKHLGGSAKGWVVFGRLVQNARFIAYLYKLHGPNLFEG